MKKPDEIKNGLEIAVNGCLTCEEKHEAWKFV